MRRIALALSLFFIFLVPWEGVVRLPVGGTFARIRWACSWSFLAGDSDRHRSICANLVHFK